MSEAAGEYNRAGRVEKLTRIKDSAGEFVDQWIPHILQKWFKVRGQTGMAVVRSGQEGVEMDIKRYSFRCRYDRSILSDMRIVMADGSVFDIKTVRHDVAGREWTDLVCETGSDENSG